MRPEAPADVHPDPGPAVMRMEAPADVPPDPGPAESGYGMNWEQLAKQHEWVFVNQQPLPSCWLMLKQTVFNICTLRVNILAHYNQN